MYNLWNEFLNKYYFCLNNNSTWEQHNQNVNIEISFSQKQVDILLIQLIPGSLNTGLVIT